MSPSDEFARIDALTRGLGFGPGVVLGPGDDAAVLRPRAGHDLVVTTDTFVEGRHFRREQLPLEAIGRRLAAANLSDLAAMAAEPRWALFSLAIGEDWREAEVIALRPVFVLYPEMVGEVRARAEDPANYRGPMVGGPSSAGGGPLWHYVDPRDVARAFRLALEAPALPRFEGLYISARSTLAP